MIVINTCCHIIAHPIRIIPFDLGRQLSEKDKIGIRSVTKEYGSEIKISQRQSAMFKGFVIAFEVDLKNELYIFENGMAIAVIKETAIDYSYCYESFAIAYGENRKAAHTKLFSWEHESSDTFMHLIRRLRTIVKNNTGHKKTIRRSANESFENAGMSYVMTLSMFETDGISACKDGFKSYPMWMKKNLYALLDPSLLYLEDSSSFFGERNRRPDLERMLCDINAESDLHDYERHRHIAVYMSWAAVVVVGEVQKQDMEEYISLEVQLQCDWYYTYCLDKAMPRLEQKTKNNLVELQHQVYELKLLEDRLLDFDDSSIPSRVIDIQKGLVKTSGLQENIEKLKSKTDFIIEKGKIEEDARKRRLAQSSEILLFVIAFIEIAPTVATYGDRVLPNMGMIANIVIISLGLVLLTWKNR